MKDGVDICGTRCLLLCLLMLLGLTGCQDRASIEPALPPVHVYAAASLADVMTELGVLFEQRSGQPVRFNFANSGTLARQIELGAPADLFISADMATLQRLQQRSPERVHSSRLLVQNRLVAVALPESQWVGMDPALVLANDSEVRIAIGTPGLVPAGTYAQKFLQSQMYYPHLQQRLLPLESPRAVLSAVVARNAGFGFVYATDARIESRVVVWFECPPETMPVIEYPAVLLTGGKQGRAAAVFADFLHTADAKQVFRSHGFIPTDSNHGNDDLALR